MSNFENLKAFEEEDLPAIRSNPLEGIEERIVDMLRQQAREYAILDPKFNIKKYVQSKKIEMFY